MFSHISRLGRGDRGHVQRDVNVSHQNTFESKGVGGDKERNQLRVLLLPFDMISVVAFFLDGPTLAAMATVSKGTNRLLTPEHWRTAAASRWWLQRPEPDPSSFSGPTELSAYWKGLCFMGGSSKDSPAGRLLVLGGSHQLLQAPTPAVESFLDSPWGVRLEWEALTPMPHARCAAASAVDRWGQAHVVGGFNGNNAMTQCERLSLPLPPNPAREAELSPPLCLPCSHVDASLPSKAPSRSQQLSLYGVPHAKQLKPWIKHHHSVRVGAGASVRPPQGCPAGGGRPHHCCPEDCSPGDYEWCWQQGHCRHS
ncbi:unnamed protein product, partial [Discosporangium mesarthrocarpum]